MNQGSEQRFQPELYHKQWIESVEKHRAVFEATDSSALLFGIGKEILALPALAIQEVTSDGGFHSVPHRRGGLLLGIASWRGQLLTCVSLSALLGLGGAKEGTKNGAAMLVVQWHGSHLGIPVDHVIGTWRFRRADLKPSPAAVRTAAGWSIGFLEWNDRLVLFLDTERIMAAFNENLA